MPFPEEETISAATPTLLHPLPRAQPKNQKTKNNPIPPVTRPLFILSPQPGRIVYEVKGDRRLYPQSMTNVAPQRGPA